MDINNRKQACLQTIRVMRLAATTKGVLAAVCIAALVWNGLTNNLLPSMEQRMTAFVIVNIYQAVNTAKPAINTPTPQSSSSTTTLPLTTSILPPCGITGTHYFHNGTYHQYPDSSGVRKALRDGSYGATSREGEPIGMLWAVSGGWTFAKNQFLPTVEYLRNELGIPDAYQRQQQQDQQSRQSQQQPLRWALATTPDFCEQFSNKNLNPIPFFDALVIISEESLQAEYPNNTFSRSDDRHFHKGVKVKAMQQAPFPITTFIDVDMVPCRKDFHQILLSEAIAKNNRSRFDIALPSVVPPKYGHNDTKHYMWDTGGFNVHNSACVMLNTTSHRTLELLDKYKDNFMTVDTRRTDQRSLGEAIYDVWDSHREDADGGFLHVDLEDSRVCRKKTSKRKMGKDNYFCSSTLENDESNGSGIGSNNRCLLIHKPEKGRPSATTTQTQ